MLASRREGGSSNSGLSLLHFSQCNGLFFDFSFAYQNRQFVSVDCFECLLIFASVSIEASFFFYLIYIVEKHQQCGTQIAEEYPQHHAQR